MKEPTTREILKAIKYLDDAPCKTTLHCSDCLEPIISMGQVIDHVYYCRKCAKKRRVA